MVNRSRRRIAGVAAASWVLATAITSLVVWRAVAAFDDGTSTNILSAPQVAERLSVATATSTPTPVVPTPATSASGEPSEEPSDTPTSTSSATPATTRTTGSATTATSTPPAIPVVKTWTVTGGTVSVSCQAAEISLVYASPQDGWRVEIEKRGPVTVEVDLTREGQGTKLMASCVNGIPRETTEANQGHD